MRTGRKTVALVLALLLACVLLVRRAKRAEMPATTPLLLDDPAALAHLETRGFAFADVVGPTRLAAIAATVEGDMAEFMRGVSPADPSRRSFQPRWLARARFELIGVVNRVDRAPFDPPGSALCGEVRLVYRLALTPQARPVARLPMTVNVRIPQPRLTGDADCRGVARRWRSNRDVAAILATLESLPPYTKVEINYQSVHVPAVKPDMDDNAQYVLRAFKIDGASLAPDTLFNTPRADLTARERADLVAWIVESLDAIDRGTAVVPERFLATRAVSVSPRGVARLDNRPFSQIFADASAFAGALPRARALVTTPELLLRRLDEATCQGCHQTRGVAGFHLLGEERDPRVAFNALAVGHSPHLKADLEWRARFLESVARGSPPPSRPFAGHPRGAYGDPCGLVEGFASWKCAPDLECRDIHHADVGACGPALGGDPGDPCENVRMHESSRPEGAVIAPARPDATCHAPASIARVGRVGPLCFPNWLGFAGGMCTAPCFNPGEAIDGSICAQIPLAGYEHDCLASLEPIEACLKRYSQFGWVAKCSADHLCRDDYVCVRVAGSEPGVGGCMPPYFAFQIRVDGPRLDR